MNLCFHSLGSSLFISPSFLDLPIMPKHNRCDDSGDDNDETRQIQHVGTTIDPLTQRKVIKRSTECWGFDQATLADVAATQTSETDLWHKNLGICIIEVQKMTMASHTLCDQFLQAGRGPVTSPGYRAEHKYTTQKGTATASVAMIQRRSSSDSRTIYRALQAPEFRNL